MLRYLRGFGTASLGVLALLMLGPASAQAAKVSFRNDGPTPVIVQGSVLVKGAVVRGKPLLINPGKTASWDSMPPGSAIITIQDARVTTRTLYQGPITCGTDDLSYAVQPEPGTAKAKLEPIKAPAMAAPR